MTKVTPPGQSRPVILYIINLKTVLTALLCKPT